MYKIYTLSWDVHRYQIFQREEGDIVKIKYTPIESVRFYAVHCFIFNYIHQLSTLTPSKSTSTIPASEPASKHHASIMQ